MNTTHNIIAIALLCVALTAGWANGSDKKPARSAGDARITRTSAIACHSESMKLVRNDIHWQ